MIERVFEFVCPRCGFRMKTHRACHHYCLCASGDHDSDDFESVDRLARKVSALTRMTLIVEHDRARLDLVVLYYAAKWFAEHE